MTFLKLGTQCIRVSDCREQASNELQLLKKTKFRIELKLSTTFKNLIIKVEFVMIYNFELWSTILKSTWEELLINK